MKTKCSFTLCKLRFCFGRKAHGAQEPRHINKRLRAPRNAAIRPPWQLFSVSLTSPQKFSFIIFFYYTRERKHFPMIVRGFLVRDKEGSSVAYSVVRKLEPDAVSRQKDRTGTENVFVRGCNYILFFIRQFFQCENYAVLWRKPLDTY
jgi:hypothetical protein